MQASLLDQVRNAVIATDLDGLITFWNRWAENMYQWKSSEVLGKSHLLLVPDELKESASGMMRGVAQTGFWEGVFPAQRKDGTTFPVFLTGTVLRDSSGSPCGFVGVSEDFTGRKRLEDELNRQKEQVSLRLEELEHLYAFAPVGLYVVDRNLRFLRINEHLAATSTLTAEEHLGRTIRDVIPQLADTIEQAWADVMTTGQPRLNVDIHGTMEPNPGLERHWLVNYFPLRSLDGTVVGGTAAALEITEYKRLEREREALYKQVLANREELLRMSRRLIQSQEEERRRLAGELHDEIGQVLTAVSLNLQSTSSLADEVVKGQLKDSLAIVDRAIDQVRSMSLDLRPAMLDLMGLESALRWFVDRQKTATGIQIELVSALNDQRILPELETAYFRIVQESLTNVARHANARTVRIEIGRSGGQLVLFIQDDGIGFDVRAARSSSMTGRSFGLLGMEERVRLLNGVFQVDSEIGRGTTVQARLPLE